MSKTACGGPERPFPRVLTRGGTTTQSKMKQTILFGALNPNIKNTFKTSSISKFDTITDILTNVTQEF